MDESKLKKQLVRITVITIISSILFSIVGISLLAYVGSAARETDYVQMQEETREYKNRILKQMKKNFQILSTLSKAFEVNKIYESEERLEETITKANLANDFIGFSYFGKDGYGISNTIGYGTIHDVSLDDMNDYAKDSIEQAFKGINSVSRMYDSDFFDRKIFLYAVPVYKDDVVVGVLSANDTIEIFTDLANGNYIMNGNGYIHLINSKGEYLVRSENSIVKEENKTIFEGTFLTDEAKEETIEALSNNESVFNTFTYLGDKYYFYIEPLNINGWYLFCADTALGYSLSVDNTFGIIGFVLILIFIFINFMLFGGYIQVRKSTKKLLHIAYWDSLTGAENILKFDHDFLELTKTQRNYSTVALNIHNFKCINDLFGKSHGDQVLIYVKKVIDEKLKEGEFFCRSSADTFFIVMFDVDESTIYDRINSIITHIRNASVLHGSYSYELSLYSGAVIRGDREKALIALQSIKHSHQKNIAFYNEELHKEVRKRNSIESYMHLALKNNEFKLFLQPKYSLKDDAIIGAEALVRWQNPNGSYRYPNEFIPLFESNGFCLKLDMYMIEKACKLIRKWIDEGKEPLPISVNQSKLQFSDRNYPNNLEEIINKYNIPASLITLEILEGVASNDLELLNHQIEALHEKGFKVSMDDFGSGYSSLNMIYQLKIDELKLDRGFLRKSQSDDEKRREIVLEQIIKFANNLGIATVAEGIETEDDKIKMKSLGCDYGQGYFYEKPIIAEEFSSKYISER